MESNTPRSRVVLEKFMVQYGRNTAGLYLDYGQIVGPFKGRDGKCGFYYIGKTVEFLNGLLKHQINVLEPLIFQKHTRTVKWVKMWA